MISTTNSEIPRGVLPLLDGIAKQLNKPVRRTLRRWFLPPFTVGFGMLLALAISREQNPVLDGYETIEGFSCIVWLFLLVPWGGLMLLGPRLLAAFSMLCLIGTPRRAEQDHVDLLSYVSNGTVRIILYALGMAIFVKQPFLAEKWPEEWWAIIWWLLGVVFIAATGRHLITRLLEFRLRMNAVT